MNQPLLDIQEVDASYGPIQALNQVSMHIHQGEIVTLVGANGAGKSTLLMSLFGNPGVTRGEIHFDGTALTSQPGHKIASLGIALVPEGRHVFAQMSVEENLIMGTTPIGTKHVHEDLEKMYELFPILEERKQQNASTLSGGEQQMLAIARGLMSRPRLLLLDEPSLGLAPIVVQQIFSILKEVASGGMTIFLVEQNVHHALKLANRGYVMANGRIKLGGTGTELLSNREVREAYMGG
ncbi:ABC transporter ATP-binding protein [Endozoicomonas arenosclerae]|uniref:ABC transporter ATP-binding protein n=1 Tax=Endozoicomonas arenosclerae TaxID=1633495 RepID=UPI000782B950|nr:ABC transporter ATP-binding protein [Endozoicomonas arenosclerae]